MSIIGVNKKLRLNMTDKKISDEMNKINESLEEIQKQLNKMKSELMTLQEKSKKMDFASLIQERKITQAENYSHKREKRYPD